MGRQDALWYLGAAEMAVIVLHGLNMDRAESDDPEISQEITVYSQVASIRIQTMVTSM